MSFEWYEILSICIGVAGALLGVAFGLKFKQAVKLLAELGEALVSAGKLFGKAAEALEDRKVTKAESVLLLKAWQETYTDFVNVYTAIVALLPANAVKFLFRR